MEGRIGIRRIEEVRAHRSHDSLECARVGGFEVVVPAGRHRADEEVVYLPRGAAVPGALAAGLAPWIRTGPATCTVEAMEVAGEVSEGLLVPLDADPGLAGPNADPAEVLGIGRPGAEGGEEMEGASVAPTVPMALPRWEPEDWRWDPEALADGRPMAAVELPEGLQAVAGWRLDAGEQATYLATGAMAAQGLCAPQWETEARPAWHRALEGPAARLREGAGRVYIHSLGRHAQAMAWIGVVVGPGMGGPGYGRERPEWIAVAMRVQVKAGGRWLAAPMDEMARRAQEAGIEWARPVDPVEVHGPVTSAEVRRVQALADGPSPLAGDGQGRAGVVVHHRAGGERKIVSLRHTLQQTGCGARPGRACDG